MTPLPPASVTPNRSAVASASNDEIVGDGIRHKLPAPEPEIRSRCDAIEKEELPYRFSGGVYAIINNGIEIPTKTYKKTPAMVVQ
jgi:hypothetical protein